MCVFLDDIRSREVLGVAVLSRSTPKFCAQVSAKNLWK